MTPYETRITFSFCKVSEDVIRIHPRTKDISTNVFYNFLLKQGFTELFFEDIEQLPIGDIRRLLVYKDDLNKLEEGTYD